MATGLAIGVSLLLGVSLGLRSLILIIPIVVLLSSRDRSMRLRLVALVIVCGLLGTLRTNFAGDVAPVTTLEGSSGAIGVVTTVPVAGGQFERTTLSLERVRGNDHTWRDARGSVIVYLPDQGEGLSYGDEVFVAWDATDVEALSPGYANYVRTHGATASAWVYSYDIQSQGPSFFDSVSDLRRHFSRLLQSSFQGDAGALAAGIVTGDDSAMSDGAEEAFRRTGTAHVTAVSGQNVSLLIAFLSLWMRPSGRVQRFASHTGMIVAVWLFALMVGLEPPALRASVVATLTILGAWSGRRPDPLTLLALSLGGMALLNPDTTHSVGFWLSASASAALCSVIRVDAPDGVMRKLANLAMGPLAASLGTLPVLVWTFGEWSPVSPLANAVLTPIMSVLFPITYGYALLATLPSSLAAVIGWIPGIGLDVALSVVDRMAEIAPQVHLDDVGETGAIMIAVPALVLLFAWSRESARWLRVLASRW